MRRDWTRDELNAIAERIWDETHAQVPHTPWCELPDYRRAPWRRAARAAIAEIGGIEDAHLARYRRDARRTVRVA